MIIVTITSATSFAGQRFLTWVCILAGGSFVSTFILPFRIKLKHILGCGNEQLVPFLPFLHFPFI